MPSPRPLGCPACQFPAPRLPPPRLPARAACVRQCVRLRVPVGVFLCVLHVTLGGTQGRWRLLGVPASAPPSRQGPVAPWGVLWTRGGDDLNFTPFLSPQTLPEPAVVGGGVGLRPLPTAQRPGRAGRWGRPLGGRLPGPEPVFPPCLGWGCPLPCLTGGAGAARPSSCAGGPDLPALLFSKGNGSPSPKWSPSAWTRPSTS